MNYIFGAVVLLIIFGKLLVRKMRKHREEVLFEKRVHALEVMSSRRTRSLVNEQNASRLVPMKS